MWYSDHSGALRVLQNPEAVAERLAIWSEDARRAGRLARADQLLLAAWEAFDLPSVSQSLAPRSALGVSRRPSARRGTPRNWMGKAA